MLGLLFYKKITCTSYFISEQNVFPTFFRTIFVHARRQYRNSFRSIVVLFPKESVPTVVLERSNSFQEFGPFGTSSVPDTGLTGIQTEWAISDTAFSRRKKKQNKTTPFSIEDDSTWPYCNVRVYLVPQIRKTNYNNIFLQ